MKNERGAIADYALLAALIAVVAFVPAYRFFQAQTKPFCQILGPLSISGVKELRWGKNLSWGAVGTGEDAQVACYTPFKKGAAKNTSFPPQFYAGSVIIDN